jgi:Helix-turn-helix domain
MKWQMGQRIIEEPGVNASPKVVGLRLLHHLNTQSGQCNPSYATIAAATGLSRDTVMSAVAQLEAVGIIKATRSVEKGQQAQPGQRLPSNNFTFDFSKLDQPKKPTTPSRKSQPPQSNNSTTPVGNVDHPQSEIPARGSRKSRPKIGNRETGKEESGNLKPQESLFALVPASNEAKGFELVWQRYPLKDSEAAARKIYKRIIKKKIATEVQILAGVTLMEAAWAGASDLQYCPRLVNWLRDERWKDQVVRGPRAGGTNLQTDEMHQSVAALQRWGST